MRNINGNKISPLLRTGNKLFPHIFTILALDAHTPDFLKSALLNGNQSIADSTISARHPLPADNSTSKTGMFTKISGSNAVLSASFTTRSGMDALSSIPSCNHFCDTPKTFAISLILRGCRVSPFSILATDCCESPIFQLVELGSCQLSLYLSLIVLPVFSQHIPLFLMRLQLYVLAFQHLKVVIKVVNVVFLQLVTT